MWRRLAGVCMCFWGGKGVGVKGVSVIAWMDGWMDGWMEEIDGRLTAARCMTDRLEGTVALNFAWPWDTATIAHE